MTDRVTKRKREEDTSTHYLRTAKFPWNRLWDIAVLAFWKECDADPDVLAARLKEMNISGGGPTKEQIRSRIRTHEFNECRKLMGV